MTTLSLFPFEHRSEWAYMPGVFREQFGDDISWFIAGDPEDEPLGYTRRPLAGEWSVDDEFDAIPDWWPNGVGTIDGNLAVDWNRRSPSAEKLLAADQASLSRHDGMIRRIHDRLRAAGARVVVEYSESGCRGRADLLIEHRDRCFSVEAKSDNADGSEQALAWADLLRGDWTPVVVVPDPSALHTLQVRKQPSFRSLVQRMIEPDLIDLVLGIRTMVRTHRERVPYGSQRVAS